MVISIDWKIHREHNLDPIEMIWLDDERMVRKVSQDDTRIWSKTLDVIKVAPGDPPL